MSIGNLDPDLQKLVARLDSSNLDTRLAAIMALAASLAAEPNQQIILRLLELLKDSEPRVRLAVVKILEPFSDDSDRVVPAIEALLTDQDLQVQGAARKVL
ncbi:MAG TPA: HEAT repeat domain-containing protein, partial [Phototrophicaceae bacterium]|nr:HEAT repeat domain-containing protein [Phototrophicaceae bacterium]